jgi:murein DD-endopeptidase MepM/ murein hydrolase activator NlpD
VTSLRKGSRLRIVATEDTVDGAYGRYAAVDAVEYLPPRQGATSLRVYYYVRGGVPDEYDEDEEAKARKKRRHEGGFYDAKGRQPYHGGWRKPIPFAPVTSRFNPNRLHPVLHVVMPHTGVDFGATSGTPIYSTAAGVVKTVGDGGACGNMVQVMHPNGLVSIYCHMSRFAPGLHPEEKVETRQLLGFVGATGRVTGPHLHFAVKRGETFIDPLTLNLDGMRVLPHADRTPFTKLKEEMDAELDAIALPDAEVVDEKESPDGGESAETFFEETP